MTNNQTCIQCSLAFFCFYNNANLKPKKRLLKRKETLHHTNDAFTSLYAIERGALKTHETDPAGHEVIRGLYLQDEVYGYEAISKGHYLYSSTALTDSVLCEISYPDFLEFIQSEPELLKRTLYLMSQQISAGTYLKSIKAHQKLSAFLLDLSTRLANNTSPPNFLLPLSYQDMGHYLGLATETVSRILSQLKQREIISIENKHIYFLQPDELKRIAIYS